MAFMNDVSSILGQPEQVLQTQHSTSKKAGKDLDTTDFLTLMCAMFQNQDIDNTASTTDMMNQMVQISVIQAITDISALINDTSVLTYASSLVGQTVTIGQYTGGELTETVGVVTGTGQLNGEQVIFIGDDVYKLSDVMAVGKLPEVKDPVKPGNGTDKPNTDESDKVEGPDKPGDNTDDKVEGTPDTKPEETPDNKPDDGDNSQTNNGEAQANPEVRMA